MHVLVFLVWVVSLVLLAIAALFPKPVNLVAAGLFAFDLWIGLQFLVEVSDPVRF